jgi:hypothetical protein
MFSIISISVLALFSSQILSSFSSPFASLGFLGSVGCIGARLEARPRRLVASCLAASYLVVASNAIVVALYASRSWSYCSSLWL